MQRLLARLLISAILIAAAVFITGSPEHHSFWRYAAAFVVGLQGLVQFWLVVADRLATSTPKQQASLVAALRASVIDIYRARGTDGYPLYPGDITELGFHVWLVPRWYRFMLPYGFRCWLRHRTSVADQEKWARRPKLKRAAAFRIAPQARSGVSFRKGRGVVGTCLQLNDSDRCLPINWGEPERKALLDSHDRAAWQDASVEMNKGIQYEDAVELAKRYGQAAAIVLHAKDSDEAIGCVTIDLPHGIPLSLEEESGVELLGALTATRNQVQQVLLL